MPLDDPTAASCPTTSTSAIAPCPITSTTAEDALNASRIMPEGFSVSQIVNVPGGREAPYRYLRMTPGNSGDPSFDLTRGPLGVDVLAMMADDDDAMEEWMEHLGTFPTMADALARIAEGVTQADG